MRDVGTRCWAQATAIAVVVLLAAGTPTARAAPAVGTDPAFDASLAAYATFGKLGGHLWSGNPPTDGDVRRVTAFCLRMVTPVNGESA